MDHRECEVLRIAKKTKPLELIAPAALLLLSIEQPRISEADSPTTQANLPPKDGIAQTKRQAHAA
jgi:hypothetical protein